MCDVLVLSAENNVDSVGQRSVLLRDGKPCLPAHDDHILLSCRTARFEPTISAELSLTKKQLWQIQNFRLQDNSTQSNIHHVKAFIFCM